MKYKLDYDTPIPNRGTASGPVRKSRSPSIYNTLLAMTPNPNCSFLVPLKAKKMEKVRGVISGAMSHMRRIHPERLYATRYIFKEKGIRVWRIR